jgi:hypothetical protein
LFSFTAPDPQDDSVEPFTVRFYGSYDGVTPAVELGDAVTVSAAADLTDGVHTITVPFTPASAAGYAAVIVVIDADNEVLEANEDDNAFRMPIVDTSFGFDAGEIDDAGLTLPAGLVASRDLDGVFWTLNRDASNPALFAVDADGTVLGKYVLDGISPSGAKWTDIALHEIGGAIGFDASGQSIDSIGGQSTDPIVLSHYESSPPVDDNLPTGATRGYYELGSAGGSSRMGSALPRECCAALRLTLALAA